MSLKHKFILLILFALVLFGSSQYFIQRYVVLPPFQALENREAVRNVERVQRAVAREVARLQMLGADWAAEEAFAGSPAVLHRAVLDENYLRNSFAKARLNLIALYDESGRKIWAEAYELEGRERIYFTEFEVLDPPAAEGLRKPDRIENSLAGIYETSRGPMLVAVQTISKNGGAVPARGFLILGRRLSAQFFQELSEQMQLEIEAWPVGGRGLPPAERVIYERLVHLKQGVEVEVIREDHLHAHSVLTDLTGAGAVYFRISTARPIYAEGRIAARYALASVLGVGILLIALLGMLLTRLFINPTIELTKNVAAAMQSDTPVSLALKRRDEFGILADEFDTLVHRLQRINYELKHEARHDHLTGLPNRAEIYLRIQQCIDRAARRSDYKYALLFLDLDGFKPINDNFGHEFGDALLVSLAERLREFLRSTDQVFSSPDGLAGDGNSVGRIGGDEFVVLLDDLHSFADAETVAHRLQWLLKRPFQLQEHKVTCGASIGIAFNRVRYHQPDAILRDADTAMYRAKASPESDAIAVFDEVAPPALISNVTLENELRSALEQNEFELYYQPIISLDSCQPVGFEALLRWHHPRLGFVSPDDFIPLAESTGLMIPLGCWVVEAACGQIQAWGELLGVRATPPITVNLSAKQLQSAEHVNTIAAVIRGASIRPEQLRFEMTDEAVAVESERICGSLNTLCELGIQLHIDDFGADFSPVNLLHRYPFTVLKIDRKFLFNLGNSREYAALVSAVVALAHNFRIKVVAEGVETSDQLAQILALDCDFAQGFLFAPALPADEAIQLLGHTYHAERATREAA